MAVSRETKKCCKKCFLFFFLIEISQTIVQGSTRGKSHRETTYKLCASLVLVKRRSLYQSSWRKLSWSNGDGGYFPSIPYSKSCKRSCSYVMEFLTSWRQHSKNVFFFLLYNKQNYLFAFLVDRVFYAYPYT